MTEKPKRKNDEMGAAKGLADWLMLARPFEYEVRWSPADCAKQLQKLEKFSRSFMTVMTQDVKVTQVHNATYDFEIAFQRYGRNLSYYTAKANGTITFDKGVEKTVVWGTIRLGRAVIWGWAAVLLELVITLLVPAEAHLYLFVLLVVPHSAFMLLQSYDTVKLSNLLRDTLAGEVKAKRKNDE